MSSVVVASRDTFSLPPRTRITTSAFLAVSIASSIRCKSFSTEGAHGKFVLTSCWLDA